MLRRIERDQARLGMYVHALEGPWFDHPFWRKRFLLSSPDALTRLIESDVPGLVIDESRGVGLAPDVPPPAPRFSEPAAAAAARTPFARPAVRPAQRGRSPDDERALARRTAEKAKRTVARVLDGVRAGGPVRAGDVAAAADEIVAAMHRHPATMIGLTRLKTKDEYTYQHSVAVAALLVNMARSMGLPMHEQQELGVAGLLHDVGKMVVPDDVLNKPGALSDEEWALMRTHPEQGGRALEEAIGSEGGASAIVLDVTRHHHERFDGTGYPLRLRGEAISLHARMAAICDVYDALTSRRAYKEPMPPAEAVRRMHGWEGHFDPELLLRFMTGIGVHPPGLLVRLRSNRLGVTLGQRPGRRGSKSRAVAFHCTREREPIPPAVVVLGENLPYDLPITEERPEAWGIADWPGLRERLMEGARG